MKKLNFISTLIGYVQKVKKYLAENGKKDRIKEFQKGAVQFVTFLLSHFDDFQL